MSQMLFLLLLVLALWLVMLLLLEAGRPWPIPRAKVGSRER